MKRVKSLVIDTSVAVKWLNKKDEDYTSQADKLLSDVQNDKAHLIMPELAKYEVGNALLNKQAPLTSTLGSLATYYNIPIQFIPQDNEQAQKAMEIAYQNKMTFYDASFLALAKNQHANMITDNIKHQGKYKDNDVKVISLKDYK